MTVSLNSLIARKGVDAEFSGETEVLLSEADDSIQVVAYRGTLTDRSGTTSGTPGTSTQVCAANSSRRYFFIQNLSTTTDIYINIGAAASAGSGSILLAPKAGFVFEDSFVSTQAVNVVSASASIAFSAKEG